MTPSRWVGFALCAAACAPEHTNLPSAFRLALPADGATLSADALVFSWSRAERATGYTLSVDVDPAFPAPIFTRQVAAPELSISAADALPPGTHCFWRVEAANGAGSRLAQGAPFELLTAPAAPQAPVQRSPSADAEQVALAPLLVWSAAAGAARYAVELSTDAAFVAPIVDSSASIPPGVTGWTPSVTLAPGTRYFWRVLALASTRETAASNAPLSFTTGSEPGVFTLTSPAPQSTGADVAAAFAWTAAAGAEGYTFELGLDAALSSPAVRLELPAAVTSLPVGHPLASHTPYFWRVVAHNRFGARSEEGSFATGEVAGAFALLAPADGEIRVARSPELSWSPSSGATGYVVQLSTTVTFSPPLELESMTPATRLQVPMQLAGDTLYFWRVRAVGPVGDALADGSPFAFVTAVPPLPVMLLSPAAGASDVSNAPLFTWSASLDADSHVVEVSTDPTFTTVAYRSPVLPGSTAAHQVPLGAALAGSTPYFWRVLSSSAGGTTGTPAPSPFSTGVVPSPFTLQSPADGATGSPLPTLTWTAAGGASSYVVEVALDASFDGPLVLRQLATSTTAALDARCPLARSRRFYWRVLAVSASAGITVAGNAPVSFTTGATGPGGGLVWVATRPGASSVAGAFARDATGLYLAGRDNGVSRVEKRSLADGAPLWEHAQPTPLIAVALVLDATALYVVGSVSRGITIEKRDLQTGALVPGFGSGGTVRSQAGSPTGLLGPSAAALDASWLYVAGRALEGGDLQWLLEKRSLISGESDPAFGGAAGWLPIGPSPLGTQLATGIALAPPTLFVLGLETLEDPITVTVQRAWRLEARSTLDAAPLGTFAGAGAVTIDPSPANDDSRVLLADSSSLYLSGTDRSAGNAGWRVEKRGLADGELVPTFGDAGVFSSNPTPLDEGTPALAQDGARLYLAGAAGAAGGNPQWRVEIIGQADAAPDGTWGAAGVVQCDLAASTDAPTAVLADDAGVYVLGNESDGTPSGQRWRLEKRER